jgi:hypothetical protein
VSEVLTVAKHRAAEIDKGSGQADFGFLPIPNRYDLFYPDGFLNSRKYL